MVWSMGLATLRLYITGCSPFTLTTSRQRATREQSKSLGQVSWCDRESLSAVRLMHEQELFGGRVSAGSLGGEPVPAHA